MLEAGVILVASQPVFWHAPSDRTTVGLPDSSALWQELWRHRDSPGLAFAHTHPGGGEPEPSSIDLATFATIERGLGRRLEWFVVNEHAACVVRWSGPGREDYGIERIDVNPPWARALRELSRMHGAPQTEET